jgi:hypothetical protein
MTRTGFTFVLAALSLTSVLAAADERDRESLRDLDGVRVAVEDLSPAIEAKGFSKDLLRKAVETKLEQAGIRVMNAGEFPVGDPFLDVRVTTTKESSRLIGCNVEVKFVQIVFLRRNPSVTFNRAETWKAMGHMEIVPSTRLAEKIRLELSDQVDQFIAAYRSVNPK